MEKTLSSVDRATPMRKLNLLRGMRPPPPLLAPFKDNEKEVDSQQAEDGRRTKEKFFRGINKRDF